MTWMAHNDDTDWHYLTDFGGDGIRATAACGTVFAEAEMPESSTLSGEDEPDFPVFDPPLPICEGCRNWRTMREIAE